MFSCTCKRLETGLCGISRSDPRYPALDLDIPLRSGISRSWDIPLRSGISRIRDIPLGTRISRARDIPLRSGISRSERDIPLWCGISIKRDIPPAPWDISTKTYVLLLTRTDLTVRYYRAQHANVPEAEPHTVELCALRLAVAVLRGQGVASARQVRRAGCTQGQRLPGTSRSCGRSLRTWHRRSNEVSLRSRWACGDAQYGERGVRESAALLSRNVRSRGMET